jgi:hypothetical protein
LRAAAATASEATPPAPRRSGQATRRCLNARRGWRGSCGWRGSGGWRGNRGWRGLPAPLNRLSTRVGKR